MPSPLPHLTSRPARSLSFLSALFALALPTLAAPPAPLPTKYNLNAYGWLTPVKNQGDLGTCWAFANTTTFESSLLKLGLASSPTAPEVQLSEWHLATANGNTLDLTAPYNGWGGWNEFAIGYWTRGRGQWDMNPKASPVPAGGGPVLDSNNPLNNYPLAAAAQGQYLGPYVSPASQTLAPYMVSQSAQMNWNRNLNDLAAYQQQLKNAILKYGALAVYVRADNPLNVRSNPVWYDTGTAELDHAVALVGWDDDIALTFHGQSFTGGWYIQNSWGTDTGATDPITGQKGYYWVPFADTSYANVKNAMGIITRTNIHEDTGLTFAPTVIQNQIFTPLEPEGVDLARRGYEAGTTSLAATKQFLPSNSAIGAIGLWQGAAGTTVDIRIYSEWSPTGPTGTLLGEQLSVTLNPDGTGYNMIDLDQPIFLAEGQPIYILVDFGDGHSRPILVDTRTFEELTPEYGSYIGLSWMSQDGITWQDLAAGEFDYSGAIFFMKVFRLGIDLDNNNSQFAVDENFEFTVDGLSQTARDGSANTILGLQFEDGSILTLNGDLTVTLGHFNVENSYATGMIQGDHTIFVPDDFAKTGPGTLVIDSDVNVTNDAFVRAGLLTIGQSFTVGGSLNVTGGFIQFLQSSTLSVPVWTIQNAGAEIANDISGVNTLSVTGGSLSILSSGSLTADQWNVSNSAIYINGATSVNSLNISGSTLSVLNSGTLLSPEINLDATSFSIEQGGVAGVSTPLQVDSSSSVIVNGSLTAPQLTLAPNALLAGSGIFTGDVLNSGTVSPGNSPGILTINGNFTQTSSGALVIEVASADTFDQLIVSGLATLGGALVVTPYEGYVLQYGQSFQFLQAGSIEGTFDNIELPTNFRGRLLLDDNTATVLVAPSSYKLVAVTQNQQNVAAALDSFIPATSGDELTISTALDFLTAQEYPAAFDAISPAFYESLANIGIEQAFSQGQQMQQRFRSVQLGARGFTQSGFDGPVIKENDGKTTIGPDGKAAKDIITPAADNDWGVWVQGNGIFARNTSVNNVPKYNFNSGGFLGGADYRWSDDFATGLYAGYQGTYARYDGGGRTTINSTRFGGYATYGKAEGFFANTMIGGGYSAYQISRTIEFGSIDRTAKSRPDGGDFETMLNLGYNWQLGNFNIGLVGTGQYTYLGIAPFTESGADSLDLSVDQQNANSLRTMLGGQVAYTWEVSHGFALIPQASLYWQHEFMQNPRNIGSSLNGGSGPSFDYSTAAPARDAVYAGVGLTAQFGDQWNANFYYNADFGRQDFVSHMITTGLEFRW